MGGSPPVDVPAAARPIHVSRIGYVQHLDVGALSSIADRGKGRIFVQATPGSFVTPVDPVAFAEGLDVCLLYTSPSPRDS